MVPKKITAGIVFLLSALGCTQLVRADSSVPALNHVQSTYVAGCSGCHGIQGVSNNELIPDLKDRAGFWLCTAEGRKYMVRLPNVAHAALSDTELAALMNFVAFDLGGSSAPRTAVRYTPAEITRLRAEAPIMTDVLSSRHTLIASLLKSCKVAPAIAKDLAGY